MRTSLLLFAFIVFLHSVMLVSHGSGLASLYANPGALKVDLVLEVALIFVFFSLFMSFIVPVFTMVLQGLVQESPLSPPGRQLDRLRFMRDAGFVRVDDVRKAAHSTQDQYLLDLEKEAKETRRQTEEQLFRLSILSTSCLLLSGFNLLYSPASLLRQIGRAIPQGYQWVMLFLPLVFLIMAAWPAVREEDDIYSCF